MEIRGLVRVSRSRPPAIPVLLQTATRLTLAVLMACGLMVSQFSMAADAPHIGEGGIPQFELDKSWPKLPALQARFRDHTLALFEKHGMKNIMYWTPTDKPNTLIYVIAHKDKAAADASWDAFRNDPEWKKVAEETQRNGKLVDKVESVYMHLTDYSPGK